VRGKLHQRVTHILVEECQDLNQAQYRLVKALSPSGKHLFVIGDPDQSIYGFRGASAEYFQRFETDYPDAVQIRLVQNYRSSQTILDAAHQVMAARSRESATRTRLYSRVDGLKTVGIIETATETSEAVAVGKTIEAMLGGTGFHSLDFGAAGGNKDHPDMSFSDFAVLFRTGRQADSFTRMFDQAGIHYQLASREHLTARPGLCQMLALLKLTMQQAGYADLEKAAGCLVPDLSSKDIAAWVDRALQRHLTLDQALNRLQQAPTDDTAGANPSLLKSLAAGLDRITSAIIDLDVRGKIKHLIDSLQPVFEDAFTENAAALDQLLQIAAENRYDTGSFLNQVTLGTDTDLISDRAEKVALLTMHAAKGLEFDVVFMVGCEDRLLPYSHSAASQAQLDEERRLFYVAVTRARHRLFLTRARRRVHHGKPVDTRPSPFWEDIENRLKNRQSLPDAALYRKPNRQRQLGLFDP
jgi:superfamily I DNA/RNA helicase